MQPPPERSYSYDFFLSHNRADKAWVRVLADRLASESYNGRPLRPWLDEHFLDPGELGSDEELTTAIDRSRLFALILSPESVNSYWVDFEVKYILATRGSDTIIPILLRPCTPSEALEGLPAFDFQDEAKFEVRLQEVLDTFCPPAAIGVTEVKERVAEAYETVEQTDPGGFSAEPTPVRDAFYEALTRYDINDAASEGLALAAFQNAADLLLETHAHQGKAGYNAKMLLGECLAAALSRSLRYRQVAQAYIDRAAQHPQGTVLLFVVVRAFSKLAEIDLRHIDLSVMLRIIEQLDRKSHISSQEEAIEILLGRTLGKIRETPTGEFLLKTLRDGGRTSRIVTAIAISFTYLQGPSMFYVSALKQAFEQRAGQQPLPKGPPSKKVLSLLYGIDLDQDEAVGRTLETARSDLKRAFPGIDFPYSYFWLGQSPFLTVTHRHHAPFMGLIARVTLANMDEISGYLDVSHVAILTEPRVVDGLFDHCGALIILEQDPDSFQCRRLRDRGRPFAMMTAEMMAQLEDRDHIVVENQKVTVWKTPL